MELKRYIFKQLIYWLAMSTVSLIGIVWLSQTLGLIELIVNKGAPLSDLLSLTLLATPLWLIFVLPIGGLIATIIVLSKLQQDREITAMKSVGLSNHNIATAPLIFGFLISIFLFINSAFIVPLTFSGYTSIIDTIRTSTPIITLQKGVFTDLTKGLTIFVDERSDQNNFSNIFVHDTREEGRIVEIIAETGRIDLSASPPRLEFSNGTRSEYSFGETQTVLLQFDHYTIALTQEYQDLGNRPSDYNELSIPVLLKGENRYEHHSREMRAEGHFRIASPLLGLALVMVGITSILSAGYSRTGGWRQITVAAIIATFIQIAMISSRGATVTTPSLFPLMYLVGILPILIGFYLLRERSYPRKVAL